MRKINVSILVGALVAVLGAALVFAYGRSVEDRIADGRETVPVLVAAQALNAGTLARDLGGDLVQVKEVPREYVAQDALRSLDDVIELELLGPVPVGVQLAEGQFGSSQGADVVRPAQGKVAIAVGVGLTPGVARYIGANSVVDVFVTYTGTGAAANRTKLFESGLKVLSVTVAPAAATGDVEEGAPSGQDTGQVVAVLEVTPVQAERVVNATTLGSLYLALSAEGSPHRTGPGVTPDDVVRGGA